jgi:hypothetical protein
MDQSSNTVCRAFDVQILMEEFLRGRNWVVTMELF